MVLLHYEAFTRCESLQYCYSFITYWGNIVFLSVAKIVSLITNRQSFIAFVIFRKFCLFVFGATAPQWAIASSFTRFLDHTQRRTTVGRTPLGEWSARQRPLPDNTHHSQQTGIQAPGGIQTHNLSRRAATDPRLGPRGHWDRHFRDSSIISGHCLCTGVPISP